MKILYLSLILIGCSDPTEQPFTYVEKMPSFPGGTQKMYEYIYERMKYPEDAKHKNIEGQVIVQFVVENDGTLNKIKVVRGVEKSLDAEAVRVIESMNEGYKWTPGFHNRRAVPVSFTLPIKFVLKQ